MRRGFIAQKYGSLVEALYQADDHIAIEVQVLFEDGRSGVIKADLQIRDITPVAAEALLGA